VPPSPATRQRLVTLAGFVFVGASLYFLCLSMARGIRESGGIGNLLNLNLGLFLLSFAVLQIHLITCGWSWRSVARLTGGRLGFWKSYSIHFLAQVGKYIPGKVWAAIGKYALSCDSGMTKTQTGHALILETVFIVFGCLLTAMPLVPSAARAAGMNGMGAVGLAVLLGLVTISAAHPAVFGFFLGIASRLTGKKMDFQRTAFPRVLQIIPVYLVVFVTLGIGFWLLALSFGLRIPVFPGVFLYPTAMGISYLVVFAPGGLGVRELVLVWLIRMVAPGAEPGMAELVALAGRLWVTIGEVMAFMISLSLYGTSTGNIIRMFSRRGTT